MILSTNKTVFTLSLDFSFLVYGRTVMQHIEHSIEFQIFEPWNA